MRILINWLLAFLVAITLSAVAHADDPSPLPGTRPLTLEGDIASTLVDGVDRFLLRKTNESIAKRSRFWKRDFSTPEKYEASVKPNRERLAQILGLRDPRVPFEALTSVPVGNGEDGDLVASTETIAVSAVRWPAFGDVWGEGLLVRPIEKGTVARVVVIPDADTLPEQLLGVIPGVPSEEQFARRLVESGCEILIPTLIDRRVEPRNGRSKLSTREFLYRPSFELGRHLVGYEVQKVLAAVDWFVADSEKEPTKIGVFGWGEGGLIALHAGALDPRISAVVVSGYFDRREQLWREPIDRNMFGLLEQFGDAELASLIAPRALVVETARGPQRVIPPGTGGAPGRLTTPEPASVKAEVERAKALVPGSWLKLITSSDGYGPIGIDPTLKAFLEALSPNAEVAQPGLEPGERAQQLDREARRLRQTHEIDRHSQQLLAESSDVRQEYFKKLDTSTLEAFQKTIEPYRNAFREDVIGHFDDPLLPPDVRTRKTFDEAKFTGYEVVMDVFPDVIAYGLLLIPKGIKDGERRPVVVCQHGLEGRPSFVADPKIKNPSYHQYAVRLAEKGYITFAPQNLYIFGDRFRTLQRKANPLKKTLFSIIVPQHQQITDWLKTLPYVDPSRIAFYGLSYGGKSAMRVPPLVSNYCLSICSADFNEWVWKNASTRSPYSYVWTNEYEIFEWDLGSTFNYAEMASLIAPRPFMVERGHFDTVAPDEMVAHEFAKVRFLYEARLGIGDRCAIEVFTGPHTIHGVGTFQFLDSQLQTGAGK